MAFPINEAGAREYLTGAKWPSGLQQTAIRNLIKFPIRFMIIDDSGSMGASDGHRIIHSGNTSVIQNSTRWKELADIVKFQAGFAKAANALTEFRLLNNAAPVVVGNPDDNASYQQICQIMDTSGPSGRTPLCKHINEVAAQIRNMESQLRANGHKAAVVICTDGEASDGDVTAALKPLHDLPVWVVLRLCTDEDAVVNYWNGIDSQIELDLEILDDLTSEAKEVNEKNTWFTYGEPLHLLRQFGINIKELDMLDEAKLSVDQIRDVCAIIFGGSPDDYPHPGADAKGFVKMVNEKNKVEPKVFNPVTKKMSDWIDVSKLKDAVGAKCIIS
eukprot:TRINITY_DN67042_c0_g1_i5.p1 TRINITY_DN67042_c0_g1~~TRINITY_DN67042_c0_g1_i5.p1  ORF type:complete len:331 (-),score=12.05 TRINITY_DN67042_c0_g1_i5:134-1126(-)